MSTIYHLTAYSDSLFGRSSRRYAEQCLAAYVGTGTGTVSVPGVPRKCPLQRTVLVTFCLPRTLAYYCTSPCSKHVLLLRCSSENGHVRYQNCMEGPRIVITF